MYIILAFLIGVAIILATILNGKLGEKIGLTNGVMINYFVGTIASLLLCFIMRDKIPSSETLFSIPTYYFLGGFIGMSVTFLFNIMVPNLSAVHIVILPFIGQIFTSSLIDYYYLDIASPGKVIGGILFLVGLLYDTKISNTSS